jgi:hypothetical protein
MRYGINSRRFSEKPQEIDVDHTEIHEKQHNESDGEHPCPLVPARFLICAFIPFPTRLGLMPHEFEQILQPQPQPFEESNFCRECHCLRIYNTKLANFQFRVPQNAEKRSQKPPGYIYATICDIYASRDYVAKTLEIFTQAVSIIPR